MNKTIRIELELEIDEDSMENLLTKIRKKLIEIDVTSGVRLVTTWEFNKRRGIWLTYGWGFGKGRTQIWVPLVK